jgi:hypothetical protein
MRIVSLACEKPYVDKPADLHGAENRYHFSDEYVLRSRKWIRII